MPACRGMSDESFPGSAEAGVGDCARADMSLSAAIATLKRRLASAQVERDGWDAAGDADRCLGAGYRVEALRLQLERLELAARAAASKSA